MTLAKLAALAAATTLTFGSALAQEAPAPAATIAPPAPAGASALSACLIQNHDPSIEAPMKAFLLAALQDQKEAAQSQVMAFGMAIAQSAMSNCDVTLQQMQAPGFQADVEGYGAWVGEKIMTEAMSGLGVM